MTTNTLTSLPASGFPLPYGIMVMKQKKKIKAVCFCFVWFYFLDADLQWVAVAVENSAPPACDNLLSCVQLQGGVLKFSHRSGSSLNERSVIRFREVPVNERRMISRWDKRLCRSQACLLVAPGNWQGGFFIALPGYLV